MRAKGCLLGKIYRLLDLSDQNSKFRKDFHRRSEIKIKYEKDTKGALEDMNEAIKLEPHYAGYFINRAFMKYMLDDYFGAMADYDYALSLDPTNVTAYYNRALLKMEVSENNKAIEDFSYVLRSDPKNMLARYNRASLYYKTGQYKFAISDYDELLWNTNAVGYRNIAIRSNVFLFNP